MEGYYLIGGIYRHKLEALLVVFEDRQNQFSRYNLTSVFRDKDLTEVNESLLVGDHG